MRLKTRRSAPFALNPLASASDYPGRNPTSYLNAVMHYMRLALVQYMAHLQDKQNQLYLVNLISVFVVCVDDR
jgi:hypothetical protein